MYRYIHALFLTYEPYFVRDSYSVDVENFYINNLKSYISGAQQFQARLTVVDAGSSSEFIQFISEVTVNLGLEQFIIHKDLSSIDAFNAYVANNKNKRDLYIWLASDTRASDNGWLASLMEDMRDAKAQIAYPAVTSDGSGSTPQTQSQHLNQIYHKVCFPNFCNLICMAISGEVLVKSDWTLPNKYKKNGNDKGISLLAYVTHSTAIISFRCHLEHLQNFPKRHAWTNDASRSGRELEYLYLSVREAGVNAFGSEDWNILVYMERQKLDGVGFLRALLNYLRLCLRCCISPTLRRKLMLQKASAIVGSENMKKIMRLSEMERIRIIKEIYWD